MPLDLRRRIGPLPVWAWGLVGVTGIGLGLYLRSRRQGVVASDGSEFLSSDAALPVDVTPGTPSWESIPGTDVPPDPILPDLPALPEEPIFPEPELVGCPDGYIMDIFGRCVPDPWGLPLPEEAPPPGEPPGGPGGVRDRRRLRARLRQISKRIKALRRGGVTPRERKQLVKLRKRRKRIRGRL